MTTSETEINTGGPAFPLSYEIQDRNIYDEIVREPRKQNGMTLRDYFAGQVDVSAYTPVDSWRQQTGGTYPTVHELADFITEIRFAEANAMIERRERQ